MWLYILKCNSYYKIGVTNNFEKRMKTYNCHNPSFQLAMKLEFKKANASKFEEYYLKALKSKFKSKNDWIKLTLKEAEVLFMWIEIDYNYVENGIETNLSLKFTENKSNRLFIS